MTREEFMDIVYYELDSDDDNYRANRIIDAADEYAEDSNSEKPNKWIPVSERLPEDCLAVLVWCPERKNIYCAYRELNQWWIFGTYFEKIPFEVVAWQPLPKPYKAESEE